MLSDANIRHILNTLSPSDVSDLANVLEQALVRYSCGNEQQYQPHRGVITRPTGQTTLFMPASTEHINGFKIVGIAPTQSPSTPTQDGKPVAGLKSVLTLCDSTGTALGSLNAAALTAFRTSLGSILMYRFRRNTANISVFGAGKQALWHIRLAVLLRGKDIKSITVVNRSAGRTKDLIESLTNDKENPWPSHISINAFDPQSDRDAALESLVVDSDVLFFTTPSTEPLFPASYLTSEKALAKTRFISAIGSYKLNMQEIDPELLKKVIDTSSVFGSSSYGGGIITVDSREGCLSEAGELVRAEIPPSKLLEIGQLLNEKATSSPPDLTKWLEEGFVIYKSVGIGIMDLAVGQHLLTIAKAKNIGLTAEDF